jgi:hypothetical protein
MKKAGHWALWIALTPIRAVHELYLGFRDGMSGGPPPPPRDVKPDWLHKRPG